VWDLEAGRQIASLGEEPEGSVAFLPDGKRFVFKPQNGRLEIRDARTAKLLATFEDSSPEANLLALSPDGKFALTGNPDREAERLRLVDVGSRKVLKELEGRYCSSAVFTPDGKMAYVAFKPYPGQDYAFGVWQIPSGKMLRSVSGTDEERLYPLAFSPDGKLAVSQRYEKPRPTSDYNLVLWDATSGAELRRLRGPAAPPPPATPFTYPLVICAAFRSDSACVVAILTDGSLRRWEVDTGREVWTKSLDTQREAFTASALSRDVKRAVTGSTAWHALKIEVWDAWDGHLLKELSASPPQDQ
jgi:WD40 repeat protein